MFQRIVLLTLIMGLVTVVISQDQQFLALLEAVDGGSAEEGRVIDYILQTLAGDPDYNTTRLKDIEIIYRQYPKFPFGDGAGYLLRHGIMDGVTDPAAYRRWSDAVVIERSFTGYSARAVIQHPYLEIRYLEVESHGQAQMAGNVTAEFTGIRAQMDLIYEWKNKEKLTLQDLRVIYAEGGNVIIHGVDEDQQKDPYLYREIRDGLRKAIEEALKRRYHVVVRKLVQH